MSTRSSATKVKVKVTDIEAQRVRLKLAKLKACVIVRK
jgi:hypothetical protein